MFYYYFLGELSCKDSRTLFDALTQEFVLTVAMCRFVAMHTMQEADTQNATPDESQGNGYLDGDIRPSRRPKEGRSARLVLAAVGGMLLPLITQIGHAH